MYVQPIPIENALNSLIYFNTVIYLKTLSTQIPNEY